MNYSEINEDLIVNRDFYKQVLSNVSSYASLEFYNNGVLKGINFDRSCAFIIGSIFTIKYNERIDDLLEHLEQVDWDIYMMGDS